MRESQWEIRCYAERQAPGLWIALCLDFDLAAQGETFQEARSRLDAMIDEYVEDALTGEDRDHAQALLNRRAPRRYWLRYYWFDLVRRVRHRPPSEHVPFREAKRLALAA